MAYEVTIGEEKFLISVRQSGELLDVAIGDKVLKVDLRRPAAAELSVIIEGRSYDVYLEKVNDSLRLRIGDQSFEAVVRDERKRLAAKAAGSPGAEGEQVLTSAMPGKVVKLLVHEGQEVKKNQGLVIIEAMKMENELKAPRDGVVKKIFVEESQNVEGRERLLLIS